MHILNQKNPGDPAVKAIHNACLEVCGGTIEQRVNAAYLLQETIRARLDAAGLAIVPKDDLIEISETMTATDAEIAQYSERAVLTDMARAFFQKVATTAEQERLMRTIRRPHSLAEGEPGMAYTFAFGIWTPGRTAWLAHQADKQRRAIIQNFAADIEAVNQESGAA